MDQGTSERILCGRERMDDGNVGGSACAMPGRVPKCTQVQCAVQQVRMQDAKRGERVPRLARTERLIGRRDGQVVQTRCSARWREREKKETSLEVASCLYWKPCSPLASGRAPKNLCRCKYLPPAYGTLTARVCCTVSGIHSCPQRPRPTIACAIPWFGGRPLCPSGRRTTQHLRYPQYTVIYA